MSSPYYIGLRNTRRDKAANSEAENITPTASDDLISSSSPYYKGLTDKALFPILNRESQSTTISSSSSKTSFSDKMQEWSAGCFKSREPIEEYSWVDKYRPADLENLNNKKDKAIELKEKKSDESCSPYIAEGHEAVTKPRMICEQVSEAFGPDKVQVKIRN